MNCWLLFGICCSILFLPFGLADQCANGTITSSCECESMNYSTGYCCRNIYFDPGYSSCPTGNYYFVEQENPIASDSNPGSEALPWKSFRKGLDTAHVDDVVFVKGGTHIDTTSTWDRAFVPVNEGAAGHPIIFKSYPRYGAVLERSSQGTAAMKVLRKDYIVIDGFTVHGALGVRSGSDYCVIKNNDLSVGSIEGTDGSLKWGIFNEFSSYCIIENNYVHDIESTSYDTNHNTAGIMTFGGYGVTEHNIIQHNRVDGNHTVHTAYGTKAGELFNNTWRYNYGQDVVSGFLQIGATAGQFSTIDNDVYQNIIVNSDNFDVIDHNASRNRIYNNVGYNLRYAYTIAFASNDNNEDWNNIYMINVPNSYCYYSGNEVNPNRPFGYVNHNIIICPRLGNFDWGRNLYPTLSDWRIRTGFDMDSTQQDPLFVDPVLSDFHLQNASSAINAGVDLQDYDDDLDTTETMNKGAYITGDEIIGIVSYDILTQTNTSISCPLPNDEPPCDCINSIELGKGIGSWNQGTISTAQLMLLIKTWKGKICN
jgi:hypothetical protein